ncbi:PASTA domain-containing protein [Aureivirga sp. CE67]|uniref:PASTA domain-containing protein n=1 Tax=Aureivirga sp. CE67 TaxID=1788983 RepID=UPI0018CA8F0A|nr:PASTA domain-containing protein [Aureivirga sp. CE67]
MSLVNFLKSKTFFKHLAIAIVGVILLIFIVLKWLDFTTNHDQKIQVPNLEKKSLEEAEKLLTERNLRFKIRDTANFNPKYPPYSIIEQTPEAYDNVKENRQIYLTVNPSGYRNVELPPIVGISKRNALALLKARGLQVGNKPVYVYDIAKDVVRGVYYDGKPINVGDLLPKNSVIELKLGDGKGNGKSSEQEVKQNSDTDSEGNENEVQ